MRKILIIMSTLMLLLVVTACSSPLENITVASSSDKIHQNSNNNLLENVTIYEIKKNESFFEFEGYTVAKSQIGTFDDFFGEVYVDGAKIVGARGIINVSSVNTGIEGLDTHLKTDDFFDVEKYPFINVELLRIEQQADKSIAYANLDFHGIEREVNFPVTLEENSISAEFILDTTAFNMTNAGVNKEVKIKFRFIY